MELYSQKEVNEIVEYYITEFAKWSGCDTKMARPIAMLFLEENPKALFKREIEVEEINVENLDDNGTIHKRKP